MNVAKGGLHQYGTRIVGNPGVTDDSEDEAAEQRSAGFRSTARQAPAESDDASHRHAGIRHASTVRELGVVGCIVVATDFDPDSVAVEVAGSKAVVAVSDGLQPGASTITADSRPATRLINGRRRIRLRHQRSLLNV